MTLFSRAELDAKSWLLSLRASAPIILTGLSGIVLSWLALRVLAVQIDYDAALALYNVGSSPSLALIAWTFASLGNVVWMPLVFWLYVFRKSKYEWTSALVLAVAIAASLASADLLKMAFQLPRPFTVIPEIQARFSIPTNYAFPSGHTTRAFTVAIVVWMRYRGWRVPFVALGVATGVSMIVLGLHFPSDVIAGALLGTISGTFAANLAKLRPDR